MLAVYDRLGEVRGFAESDVQLLQTVANHASVALHNEMLIGRLRHDALHDALTGLPNRSHLTALATSAVARATAGHSRVAMMIIDLNGFKVVNDTLGHHVGDELIREVAERFSSAAGPGVTVARLGGDEFAVLLERADLVEADGLEIAARMIDALTAPVRVGEDRLHLSGAVGIALAPDHATGVGDLLKRADIAMYAAKNGPENAVVYRPDIDLNDPSLLSLMGELREALTNGRIDIEVEPVIDLLAGQAGRGRGPRTVAPPDARHAAPGRVPPAGRAQRPDRPAHRAGAGPRGRGGGAVARRPAASSASRSTSRRARCWTVRCPGTVAEVLRRHRLPAHLLTLEITESIVISDADRALGLLAELRALGVRLALDDFGTGYSSLTYLSALPIQQLKIDRSFVTRIVDSSRDAAIVTSLIDLAHHLGPAGDRRGRRGVAGSGPAAPAGLRVRPGLLLRDVDGPGTAAELGRQRSPRWSRPARCAARSTPSSAEPRACPSVRGPPRDSRTCRDVRRSGSRNSFDVGADSCDRMCE